MKKLILVVFALASINSFAQTADEFYNKGLAKYKVKDFKGAIADYDKAIKLEPLANYYTNRGHAKADYHDYTSAILDYSKVIEMEPNNALAYYNRAHAYGELHEFKSAITDYAKSLELDSNNGHAYFNRGLAKHELNEGKDLGCHDFKKAQELGDKDADEMLKEYCK
ncbi:MAG: tetratricopeptide repeat protein [Bacteroidota bacterium]